MADSDQSLYNLRYNQVTQGMEGFGGGTPAWTPLVLVADGGITRLTGDVTAGPGIGSQVATLSNTSVVAGTYRNTSLTVDAKGRITAASDMIANSGYTTTLSDPVNDNGVIVSSVLANNLPRFSASCWINTAQFMAATPGSFSVTILGNVNENTADGGWQITIGASGQLILNVFAPGASAQYQATGTIIVNDGQWHHILMTYNTSTGFTLYIDGRADTLTIGGSVIGNYVTSESFHVGVFPTGTSTNTSISGITRVELWNTVLTGMNALELAQGSDISAGLIASWAFSEGTGLTVSDTVGGNTLTFTGLLWGDYNPIISKSLIPQLQDIHYNSITLSGFLNLPALSVAPAAPVVGQVYFDTTVGSFGAIKFWGTDSAWHTVTAS